MRTWLALVVLVALASPTAAATYTWSGGGGADINWSNGANWGGSGPANGETGIVLVFPALAGGYGSNNDLNGLHVTSLGITTQLSDGIYAFTGNSIALQGAVTMASPGSGNPNLVWQIPVGLAGDVTIDASGRQTQLQGPIDLGSSTLTLDTEGDIVLGGVISGSGNLVKNNSAALTITGTNTYTGSTTSNNGSLYVANAAAFGATGAGTIFNGGFLGFSGATFTTAEPFVFNGGKIVAYGTPTMAGPVTLNTTIVVQPFNAAASLTMGGAIGGSGGLTKTGPGLVILNAPVDSYAGATSINAGTLRLDAALSSTNPVTVASGSTLQGNASSAGTISVQNGGTLAPGASPGKLSSAGLTMVAGAVLAAEINGPNAVTQYDQIAVSGAINLGDATLKVTLGYVPQDGQQFTLIARPQGQPVSGTFAGLADGATFQSGGTTFTITYHGGAGSDVVLVAGQPGTPTNTPTGPSRTPTSTPTGPSPTNTTTRTPAQTATVTSTSSGTRTPTSTPTPTATGMAAFCIGDCDGNSMVAVNEVIVGVNIALGDATVNVCPRFDANGDAQVTIPELIEAVGNVLNGCPSPPAIGARPLRD